MPELPEVETVKNIILPLVKGKTIDHVEVYFNKLVLSNFKMTKVQYDENMFGYNESTSFDNLENCDLSLVFYNTKISTIVNKNSDLTDAHIKELFTKFSCSSKTL